MYTGERILQGGKFHVTFQQSLYAYEFIKERTKGKSVLDMGIGEGYGSDVLAETAREVVGLDYNLQAIELAREKYKRPNLSFVHGDFFDASRVLRGRMFDYVCSFQTIEHVSDHDAFLRSHIAVTTPGGSVVVTTPNTRMFPTFNPYHLHEVDATEIYNLFKKHFQSVELYGVFGDEQVLQYRKGKQKISDLVLAFDPFNVRMWLPRPAIQGIYAGVSSMIKSVSYMKKKDMIEHITLKNFRHSKDDIEHALDFIAIGTTAA